MAVEARGRDVALRTDVLSHRSRHRTTQYPRLQRSSWLGARLGRLWPKDRGQSDHRVEFGARIHDAPSRLLLRRAHPTAGERRVAEARRFLEVRAAGGI